MTIEYASDLIVSLKQVNKVKALALFDHFRDYFKLDPKQSLIFDKLCGYLITIEA